MLGGLSESVSRGRDDELILGSEIVLLSAARHAGRLGDPCGGESLVSVLEENLERRLENGVSCLSAALFLAASLRSAGSGALAAGH
jgi:hypothetical protein